MKLCERCFGRIPEEEDYCYICKLKIENENLHREILECKENFRKEVLEVEKRYELEIENLEGKFVWCNTVRRNLMKELKSVGCCCENCFWLSKCTDGSFTCSATRFDFEIEKERLDKCICFRYAFSRMKSKEN